MSIKPIGNRVLIKIVEAETKTASGIFIPQTAQEKTQEGIVSAIGDSDEIKVKLNDKIIYNKYSGTKFEMNGEEMLIVKAEDILAVIK